MLHVLINNYFTCQRRISYVFCGMSALSDRNTGLTHGMLAALQLHCRIRTDAHRWKYSQVHSPVHWGSWGDGTWAMCNTMVAAPRRARFLSVPALDVCIISHQMTVGYQHHDIPGHMESLDYV
jgi:hypothetical protein